MAPIVSACAAPETDLSTEGMGTEGMGTEGRGDGWVALSPPQLRLKNNAPDPTITEAVRFMVPISKSSSSEA